MQGGGGPLLTGFTMAEILLSLTIIGVVAAITLPSLTGNINERTWNTQRKALYARFSQAIALMPALNGYGTLRAATAASGETPAQEAVDTAAETFVTEGLAKVLKINNICDSDHLADCGLPTKYTNYSGNIADFPIDFTTLNSQFTSLNFNGNYYSQLNTKAAAFETQNGESIAVFYNPNCRNRTVSAADYLNNMSLPWTYTQPWVCANFIFDLNGNKGPNTVGKDIGFITALYSTDSSVVMPQPALNDAVSSPVSYLNAQSHCVKQDSTLRLPTIDELISMYVNRNLLSIGDEHGHYLSSSVEKGGRWIMAIYVGTTRIDAANGYIRCVKR